jgi:4-amino-4-deoxy-L-arabinose transferase-like glycosyltransferase
MNIFNVFQNKSLWMVFLVSFIICFFSIYSFPIYILDEAKNSEAAREMFMGGNWIVPLFNGELRTDKPPLHYFFMMIGYKLFGIGALGARFFSAVFGALTLLCTYSFVSKFAGKEQGFLAWLVLASSLFFIQVFHQAVPDPYLIFFVSTGLFCFFDFYKTRKKISLAFFYVLLGLGVLSKGPVAIALPGLIVGVFLWTKKELFSKKLFHYRPILGTLLMLLIAAPWFIAVHYATDGAWTEGFFFEHNFKRFGNEMEGHGGIFLITWAFVVLGLLPFSVFVIQAFRESWRKKKDSFILFSLIVSVVFIVFFSISSTKLPNYTMPCYPFLAVLIALYLDGMLKNPKRSKYLSWGIVALLVITIALPVAGYFALENEKQLVNVSGLSGFILMLTIGSIFSLYYFRRKQYQQSLSSIAVSWIVFAMVLFGFIYPKLTAQNPVSLSKQFIKEETPFVAYDRFDSAFPINYNRTIEVLPTLENVKNYLDSVPNGIVISNSRHRDSLFLLNDIEVLMNQKSLFEGHATIIIKNKEMP